MLFAEALAQALDRVGSYDVVLRGVGTESVEGVVTSVVSTHPDIILLDLQLGAVDGLEVLPLLQEALPEALVLVLTAVEDPKVIAAALEGGAAGFIGKAAPLREVVSGIDSVAAGHTVVPQRQLGRVVSHLTGAGIDEQRLGTYLTAREREILGRLAAGHSTTRIAGDLAITMHTTRTHIQNVLTKLGAHSRLEAAAMAVRSGIVEPYVQS